MKTTIKKPVVTEKGVGLAQKGIYMLEVAQSATAFGIKAAILALYPKVTVVKVTTSIRKGKMKTNNRTRISKQMPDRKIAFIKVTGGEISVFPKL